MASDEFPTADASLPPFRNPWPAMIVGLAAAGIAFLVFGFFDRHVLPLILLGLLGAGVAVAIRPRSSFILGLAWLTGMETWFSMDPAWDSARLLLIVLTSVAGVAAVLLLLPQVLRRVVFSLIILFHFGGILSAVFTVTPSPWVAGWVWLYVYRPYLEFMYLNNAYHFYSPEPGPGDLVWFYIKYEDGTTQWYKIPSRDDCPMAVEYQRQLSLMQAVNQLAPVSVTPEMAAQRVNLAAQYGIPHHPQMDIAQQYRPPNVYSREMLRSFARHVAHHVPHASDPNAKVASIKIYRLVHRILNPYELSQGIDPDEPWLYFPYYQGEYDPEGNLKDPNDPFLWWTIPILKVGTDKDSEVVDYLQTHADLGSPTPQDRDRTLIPGVQMIPGASEKHGP